MTEQVVRHRGGRRDEDGAWIPGGDEPLTPTVVAPGGGSEFSERSRAGEITAFRVYFPLGTDITSDDELTVRGERFGIVVNDWDQSGRGIVEVLCTRGEG